MHRPLASVVRGPTRRRQHFRTFILAALAAIAVSLVASAPAASATTDRACVELNEDYDLRNAARNSNVFLVVHESDDKDAREHICRKVEATPESRFADGAVFAYMQLKDGREDDDGVWHEGNRQFVKTTLGVKSFPSFLFVSKGMDGSSKYSSHVTHYKGSADTPDLADVELFIEKKVGFLIGNDVYTIRFFDNLAARFVSYGDASGIDYFKQRLIQAHVRFSTLLSFKEPFTTLGQLYNRAFSMSFEHGMDYCDKQVKKLEKKLEANKSKASGDKLHEMQQKIAILKAFSEPKELTPEEDRQIFFQAMIHLGLLIATIALFVIPAEEEAVNADDPITATPVDDDDDGPKKKN